MDSCAQRTTSRHYPVLVLAMASRITYDEVHQALQDPPQYPQAKTRQAALKKVSKHYVLDHGVVFRVTEEGQFAQWVTDKSKQQEILNGCHSHDMSGHLGRDKTRAKVTER